MSSLVPRAFALAALLVVPCASPQDQEGKPVLLGSLEHEASVRGLRFSDDGRTLTALIFKKAKAIRWDLKQMKRRSTVDLSTPGLTTSAAFSADGRLVLTRFGVDYARNADEKKKLGEWARVVDLETGKEKAAYHGRYLIESTLSPDGRLLAIIEGYEPQIDNPDDVRVLDVNTGKEVLTVPGKKGAIPSKKETRRRPFGVEFSPDSKTLALSIIDFSNERGTVELWDVASRKVRTTLTGSVGLMQVLFSPDGKTIATWASNEHDAHRPAGEAVKVELKLWHADTGREKAELKGHKQTIYRAAFTPDSKLLATGTFSLNLGVLMAPPELVGWPASKTELMLWDVASAKERGRAELSENERSVYLLSFSPDGRLLASFSAYGALRLWDAATCKRLPSPPGWDKLPLDSLAFSPDSKLLATGEANGFTRHSPDDGKVVQPEGGLKWFVRLWDVSRLGQKRKR